MRRSDSNSNKNNCKRRPPPPIIRDDDDVIASRTRRKKTVLAAKWDIPTPIIIQVIIWLNQDDLMNLSLVSKQSHNIIANEPGNENKIHPVFEISGSSVTALCQNLQNHFLNKETKNKLQRYQIMRFKDTSKFKNDEYISISELEEIAKNVQMNGITLLDLSSSPIQSFTGYIIDILPILLPKLREVNFSNTRVNTNPILGKVSKNCRLLEIVTSNNNGYDTFLSGLTMKKASKNSLKEIHMNNSNFAIWWITDRFAALNNHQDIFIFYKCCKFLERVSIRNIKYGMGFEDYDDD
jgi:hypothetical protein